MSGPDLWTLFDNRDVNRAHWATEFARWLTSAEQDERFNVAVGNLPLRSSEATSPAFLAQARELPGLDVIQANAANARTSRPPSPATPACPRPSGTPWPTSCRARGPRGQPCRTPPRRPTELFDKVRSRR